MLAICQPIGPFQVTKSILLFQLFILFSVYKRTALTVRMSDSLTSSTRKVNQPSIEEHQPQPSEQQEEQPQQLDEMPGAANGRLSHHKKSVCPTVTYLNIFPEAGDQFKANENGDGHMQPSRALRQETLHTGKYLELTKYHFQDSTGNERTAEGVHMVKQVLDQKPRHVKGVIDIPTKLGNLCTIAVLKKQIMCDALVLTKQYRAPLRAYTIEFPATVSVTIVNCVFNLK